MKKLLIILILFSTYNIFSQLKNHEIKVDTINKIKSKGIDKQNRIEFNIENGKLFINKNVIIKNWSEFIKNSKLELENDSFNKEWREEDLAQQEKSLDKFRKMEKIPKADKYTLLIIDGYVPKAIESGDFELLINEKNIEEIVIVERTKSTYSRYSSTDEIMRYYTTDKNIKVWECLVSSITGCM
ncbi:hypothetical protein [Wenyingzhuangia sp. IMCC45467]